MCERMMKFIAIFLLTILAGCATFKKYDCAKFEGEPKWSQITLSPELESELLGEVTEDGDSLYPLSNQRYWYLGSDGALLLCVTGKASYPSSFSPGCWVDRYIFINEKGKWISKRGDSAACT